MSNDVIDQLRIYLDYASAESAEETVATPSLVPSVRWHQRGPVLAVLTGLLVLAVGLPALLLLTDDGPPLGSDLPDPLDVGVEWVWPDAGFVGGSDEIAASFAELALGWGEAETVSDPDASPDGPVWTTVRHQGSPDLEVLSVPIGDGRRTLMQVGSGVVTVSNEAEGGGQRIGIPREPVAESAILHVRLVEPDRVEVISATASDLEQGYVDVSADSPIGGVVVVYLDEGGEGVTAVGGHFGPFDTPLTPSEFESGLTIGNLPAGFHWVWNEGHETATFHVFQTEDGSEQLSVGVQESPPDHPGTGEPVSVSGREFVVYDEGSQIRVTESVGNGIRIDVLSGSLNRETLLEIAAGVSYQPPERAQELDLSGSAWVVHGVDGIRLDDGTLVWETQPFPADIARDHQLGLAFTDSTGLWWYPAGKTEPSLISEDTDQLVSVIPGPAGPTAMTLGGPSFYSLSDGQQVDAPQNVPIVVPAETPWLWEWTAANGLTASVTDPEVNTDQEGQPSDILEPAHLTVTKDSEVLFDVPIGTDNEAWVRIHDFDGQRLILSRGPFEPAMPEETFLLIDLSTGTVAEMFVASGTRATFTGADTDWTGLVREPQLSG